MARRVSVGPDERQRRIEDERGVPRRWSAWHGPGRGSVCAAWVRLAESVRALTAIVEVNGRGASPRERRAATGRAYSTARVVGAGLAPVGNDMRGCVDGRPPGRPANGRVEGGDGLPALVRGRKTSRIGRRGGLTRRHAARGRKTSSGSRCVRGSRRIAGAERREPSRFDSPPGLSDRHRGNRSDSSMLAVGGTPPQQRPRRATPPRRVPAHVRGRTSV